MVAHRRGPIEERRAVRTQGIQVLAIPITMTGSGDHDDAKRVITLAEIRNSGTALRELVLSGLGVARLPTFVAGPYIAVGQLVPLLPDYTMPHRSLYAVFPEREFLPQKVRVFLDFITAAFGVSDPYWDRDWVVEKQSR